MLCSASFGHCARIAERWCGHVPSRPILLYTALMPLYYLQYPHQWILFLEHGPVWVALAALAMMSACDRKHLLSRARAATTMRA
jgi:hypothetical protein